MWPKTGSGGKCLPERARPLFMSKRHFMGTFLRGTEAKIGETEDSVKFKA